MFNKCVMGPKLFLAGRLEPARIVKHALVQFRHRGMLGVGDRYRFVDFTLISVAWIVLAR